MADVLNVAFVATSDATETAILECATDKIQTIIGLTICERGGADELFNLYVGDGGDSGVDYYIYDSQSLPASSTFEHTGKIIMREADKIYIKFDTSAVAHVVCSYLEQDE